MFGMNAMHKSVPDEWVSLLTEIEQEGWINPFLLHSMENTMALTAAHSQMLRFTQFIFGKKNFLTHSLMPKQHLISILLIFTAHQASDLTS